MATIKSEYYRFNGTTWDLHYFKTSADLLVETTTYKVMTADERTAIANYLSAFNAANKLVKLDGSSKIPVAHIPALGYLPLTGGTLTGPLAGTNLELSGNISVGGISYINGTITSDSDIINVAIDAIYFEGEGAWISNLKSPVSGNQAATKEYVDNLVSAGFKVKDPVKAASTANISIAVALNSLDGYTLAANDRVLLKDQTTASQNGVYQLNSSKIPVKVEADSTIGTSVFVENGLLQNDYIFVSSVLNTWSMFARPDTITAGSGLEKVGTLIRVANAAITNDMLLGSIANTKLANFTVNEGGISGTPSLSDLPLSTVSQSLTDHLGNLYGMLRVVRGAYQNYNEAPLITIPQVKAIADSKIKSEVGTAVPTETGVTTGNLYFRTIG